MVCLIPFSKSFEKIIATRIQKHLTQNQIVANEQYGFRSNVSTYNASFALMHEILSAINSKLIVGGLFCDLSKAFDCESQNSNIKIRILWNKRDI